MKQKLQIKVSLSNNFNLNNYSFEFTQTETSAGDTLLWPKYLYKMNLNLLSLKLPIQKNQIFL